jgi:hypothetical protein
VNYEQFFPASDVATFKRVKRGQQRLARVGREVAASMVGGKIHGYGKEFVTTEHGVYRLAQQANSDNSTERAAHDEMGVVTVIMGDPGELDAFFQQHGVKGGVPRWRRAVATMLA